MTRILNASTGGFRPYLILTFFCLVIFIPGQARLPVMDRDEGRFVQASTQMLETGDYLVPYYQDEPRSKKPAGIYWLQDIAVSATTGAEAREIWAYRIPSVIGAYLSVLLTFAIGATLFDRRVGLAAGIMMAISLVLVGESHLAKTDAVLLFTVLLSMWGLARADRRAAALKELPGSWGPALAFWGGLGISMLIKGPVGPAVVALTAVTLGIVRRDLGWWRALRPMRGFLIFLVVAAPWPLALLFSGDLGFISQSAGEDFIPKLISAQESHGGFPGTYLLALYPTFWPVSLLVVPAMVAAWRHLHDEGVTFALAWWVPAWIMFELVPTKLPHYVLPVYPALALLAAKMVVDGWVVSQGRISNLFVKAHILIWSLVCLVMAAGAVVAAWEFGQGSGAFWVAIPLAVIVAVGAWFAGRAAWVRNWSGGFGAISLMMLCFVPLVGFGFADRLQGLWISEQIVRHLPPAADRPPLATTGYREPSLVFLAGTETNLTSPEGAARYLAETPGAYAFVEGRQAQEFDEELRTLNFLPSEVAQIHGVNYSNGDDIDGRLYLHPKEKVPAAPETAASSAPKAPAENSLPSLGGDPVSVEGLAGSHWLLTALGGTDVSGNIETTLDIGDAGEVSGRTGCNRFMGQASDLSDGTVTLSPLVSTKMACDADRMAREHAFTSAMPEVTQMRLEDGQLSFYSAANKLMMRFDHVQEKEDRNASEGALPQDDAVEPGTTPVPETPSVDAEEPASSTKSSPGESRSEEPAADRPADGQSTDSASPDADAQKTENGSSGAAPAEQAAPRASPAAPEDKPAENHAEPTSSQATDEKPAQPSTKAEGEAS